MTDSLSGTIVLDSELYIISFNKAAAALFTDIQTGKKCYQVLQQSHSACENCPILFFGHSCSASSCPAAKCAYDDLTEVPLDDKRKLYMLSFKSIMVSSRVPAQVEKASSAVHIQSIMNSLSGDIKDIYEVDVKTRTVKILSSTNNAKAITNPIIQQQDVDAISEIYIENNVHPDDRDEFRKVVNFASMCAVLKDKPYFVYHFRLLRDNKIQYSYMKCVRNGSANDFSSVIMAFALEDYSFNLKQMVTSHSHESQNQHISQLYEERFADALANHEFVVWYQPKYDAITEKVVGAEALIRWQTPNGMIPPGEFLGVFEEDGLIQTLDEFVFREVCEQQQKWKSLQVPLIPISVNISRKSLFAPNIVKTYKDIITSYGIDPQYVPIEITENVALANAKIKPIADEFIKAGFELQMDDFGSGQSALNGLNMMHFSVVKIDKSLVDFIGNKNGDLILNYALALGKELGVQLVAEGVETLNQLAFLRDNGCDVIQGYYYSKPLPVGEFEIKVANNLNLKAQQECGNATSCAPAKEAAYDNHASKEAPVGHPCDEHIPGGFFTYEAFGEERILSSNSYLWNMFGFDNEADFMQHVKGSFKGFVAPEDLERVEKSIAEQIDANKDKMDYVEYEIVRKDGSRRLIYDYGHLVNKKDKDVFYVFVSDKKYN